MSIETSSPSLTQHVYETLRADLQACRLPPGARLKIAELSQRLSVSPGAVREALSRLTSEGLVDAEPQRGFRAAAISVADLRDLTSVRIEIEAMCLKRAIAVGDMAWESRIVACHHMLAAINKSAPGDAQRLNDGWVGAHAAFHTALVAACDSPWLLRLRDMLYAQSERYRSLSVPLARTPRDVNAEHTALMEAVIARDGERAHRLIDAHLRATMDIVLAGKDAIDELGSEPKLARRVAS